MMEWTEHNAKIAQVLPSCHRAWHSEILSSLCYTAFARIKNRLYTCSFKDLQGAVKLCNSLNNFQGYSRSSEVPRSNVFSRWLQSIWLACMTTYCLYSFLIFVMVHQSVRDDVFLGQLRLLLRAAGTRWGAGTSQNSVSWQRMRLEEWGALGVLFLSCITMWVHVALLSEAWGRRRFFWRFKILILKCGCSR